MPRHRGCCWRLLPGNLPEKVRGIPTRVILVIALLAAINAVVWAGAGIVLHFYAYLVTPAVLSYTLGLRHALDADHISAIDLMTRRLVAAGQRPVTVGTWFSLGHSTIVVVTCVVVAATSGALRERFDDFRYVGGIIGTSVSAVVLLVLCGANLWILGRLVARLRATLAEQRAARRRVQLGEAAEAGEDCGGGRAVDGAAKDLGGGQLSFEGAGVMATVFRKLFRIVDRPWKMFPIGLLFGLGFDTSSEVALLALTSLQGAQGTSMWLILIFPVLFTAGMCLLDTTDGALMMALYTSKAFSRDLVAILYYSIVLTGITVLVALSIGIIQVLSLIQGALNPPGAFWDGVAAISDHFDIIGGCICGLFLLLGLVSVLLYGPWRRRAERDPELMLGALPAEHVVAPGDEPRTAQREDEDQVRREASRTA